VIENCPTFNWPKRLYVGPATAKTYLSRLLSKFGVDSRVALAIAAYETSFATGDASNA
jgi:DNA-binding NarL/FixJ family response regulator